MIQSIIDFIDRHAVSDWRDWWRWWSTWAMTLLCLWNMLPFVLTDFISLKIQLVVSLILYGSVVIARFCPQKKLKGEE